MNYNEVKERISPCGISCEKCFAFTNGNIKHHSRELKNYLGNFENYARRFKDLLNEPVFTNYPVFGEFLGYLANVECAGCRNEKCRLFDNCKVRDCHKEKKVDFCFQCNEFPCNNTGFDENLYQRYLSINIQMKETGVEKYYRQTKDIPRYR